MSCPRCNQHAEPSATTCPACHALIAAVPVPFFRGADDWRHPSAPPPGPPPPPQTDSDLAAQFADPVFDLAQEMPAFDQHDTFETPALSPGEAQLGDLSALEDDVPQTPSALPPTVPEAQPETRSDVAANQAVVAPAAGEQVINATLAPSWRRLAALVVDALPVGGALMLMMLTFERDLEAGGAPLVPTSLHQLARVFLSLGWHAWLILAVVVSVSVAYHAFSLAFMRATVGDMLFGIRWLTLKGDPPRLGRALTRALLAVPSWLFAMFGVWYVLLSRTRRTLYDTLTGCYPVLRSS